MEPLLSLVLSLYSPMMNNNFPNDTGIQRFLDPFGLFLIGSFRVTDGDRVPDISDKVATRQLLLIGNGGSSLWPNFSQSPEFCNTGFCYTSFIHIRFRLTISVSCTTLHVNQHSWISQNTHSIVFVNEWYIDALYIPVFNWHENCIITRRETDVFDRSFFKIYRVWEHGGLSPPTTWKRELRFTQGGLYPTTTDGVRPREGSKNAGLLAKVALR